MPEMKEPSNGWIQVLAQFSCVIVVWGGIILGCMGMYSCDKREREAGRQRIFDMNQPYLDANDSKVKILWVYPMHGHKGRFVGHYAVCEGFKNKVRKEIHTHPLLPVPEEVWLIKLDANGYIIFDKKIDP